MKIHKIIFICSFFLLCLLTSCNGQKGFVKNLDEFNLAVKAAKPGDKIVLASGIWTDVELAFAGTGTEQKPITLTVQEKGKTTLEGLSNLQIAGEWLVVEGLVFKNGYTPTSEVISFKTSDKELANHCRVTECVIDNYSNPERFESDYWVGIYGKHNRFDHNYLTGKRNSGVTVAVRLTSPESQENYHRLDHNYFGHHPVLGSNGGETLRIGTSHFSMSNSNTLVEFNYFDRCNGEHEIISNKSCQNIYRNNTFHECQGTLTMRHGNETLVESNYFFGNGKANTGGIRVINEKQKVVNNYCEGLTGYRFRGALVVMNGVPNSPLNRYFQVKDSEVSNNTFVNCDYVQLCAGTDSERSATPENTTIANNLFYNEQKSDLFTVYDDISGITFANNLVSPNIKPIRETGFFQQKLDFKPDVNGVKIPQGIALGSVGVKTVEPFATPENTGVTWYPRVEEEQRLNVGKVIPVQPGSNTLVEAVLKAKSGDVLELAPGEYLMTKSIDILQPLTFRAKDPNAPKPLIQFQKSSLFNIENGGALSLEGLRISGTEAPDMAGNAVIRTSRYSMVRNYKLIIESCDFEEMVVNHSFDILKVFQNTFADSISIRNTSFRNISGNVLSLDKEPDDLGIYNAENVVLYNCLFSNVQGAALSLYRGGNDESTFGPMLTIDHCVFDKVGKGKRNKSGASIAITGVQTVSIKNSILSESQPLDMTLAAGDPVVNVTNVNLFKTDDFKSNSPAWYQEAITKKQPTWTTDGTYLLIPGTDPTWKGDDGQSLGILKTSKL